MDNINNNEVKNTHGGAREGAGRKKKENKKNTHVIFFRISDEENQLLKKYAEENDMSVGLYSKKIVLDKIIGMEENK